MPRSRVIDPVTKDYVQLGGGRQYTTTIATDLHHAFRAHRGLWVPDPDRGSNLHRIARGTVNASTGSAVENELRAAVQPFLDEGKARDFEVAVELATPGRVLSATSIVDVQSGTIDLSDVTRFTE